MARLVTTVGAWQAKGYHAPSTGRPSMATRRVPITRFLTSDIREKAARCEPDVVLP